METFMNLKLPGASAFAHLRGLSAKKGEDDEEKDMREPEDQRPEDADGKKEGRAKKKGETDEEYEERCEKEDKEHDEKEQKKGAAAENKRWATVLSSPACADRVDSACAMLAETDMTAEAILALLPKVGASASARQTSNLTTRMRGRQDPNPGASSADVPTGSKAIASSIVTAYRKASGEKE